MISNHPQFIAAVTDRKKVMVRYYSLPDGGVLDRVCGAIDYGPGTSPKDELNRYWLWDFTPGAGAQPMGLLPQEIVEIHVLGDVFDPAQLKAAPPAVQPRDESAAHAPA